MQWGEALQRWLAVPPRSIRIIFSGRDAEDFKVRSQGFGIRVLQVLCCMRLHAGSCAWCLLGSVCRAACPGRAGRDAYQIVPQLGLPGM